MLFRVRVILGLILVLAALAPAKDKKKHALPAFVLSARTVLVVVEPNAGVSVTDPAANKTAAEDVEKAIMKWGWLTPVMDAQTADLIITVRKGHGRMVEPTIAGGRVNDRPVVVESTDNAVRFGAQRGQNTELGQQTPQDNAPHPQTEVGPSEDTFAVYQGRADRPLERSPIWRYVGKDALRGPSVPAVAEFRKLVEETQKQQKSQP